MTERKIAWEKWEDLPQSEPAHANPFMGIESEDGEEAMEIQFQRSYRTWIKENNLTNRIDQWKGDREAFWKSINEM